VIALGLLETGPKDLDVQRRKKCEFFSASVSPIHEARVFLNSIPSMPLSRGFSELGGRGVGC
jgi:hypothetical protein